MNAASPEENVLGAVPAEWQVVSLENIATITTGGGAPQGEQYFSKGVYPFVRVRHFDGLTEYVERWDRITAQAVEKYNLRLFPKESVVFPRSGASIMLEKRAKLKVDSYVVGHLCVIRGLQDIVSQQFLYFLTRFCNFAKDKAGTTLPYLNTSDIANRQVPFPPLLEQKKIAAVLSKIQQAIEVQGKIIEHTKELKQALTSKLFAEGVYGEELKDTEIGLMPKSWEVVSIRDVAKFQGGYAFKSADYSKSGVRLFKISNVSFGKCVWDDVSFLPKEYLIQQPEFVLAGGDLVMAMTRPIVSGGIKVARLSDLDSPALLNQRVGRFLTKSDVDIEFLFQLVFDARFIAAISDGAGGSQQPNISSNQIECIRIPLPTIDEQRVIGKILSQIDLKIKVAENQNTTLRQLFKSMLHQLMTGQIRVNNLEIPFIGERTGAVHVQA